ncbi:MAG: gamma-glutamyl-gamma-aminobutyrate hydrolase family protein [Planctomycetaceae bacterium]|jgi:putative glutamine amidotransferase|nr:gamma-glutamyl-gamma-aminobutyrate hydrolase family protein [Planctomycetaceae bacterium]
MSVNKPLVGIVPLYDELRHSYWMLPGYMLALEHAGAVPVMLPLTTDCSVIRTLAQRLDGFLFSGGQDVAPELYGESPIDCCGAVCPQRDAMEKILLELVLESDKPVFGICRGIQLLNVFFGGTLYQDIPSQFQPGIIIPHHQTPPYHQPTHSVAVEPETLLAQILQTGETPLDHSTNPTPATQRPNNHSNTMPFEIPVNSFHHQGIHRLATELKSAAFSPDGLIEAVYHPHKRFVLGVQWHPEFSWQTDSNSRKIFAGFVQHCER